MREIKETFFQKLEGVICKTILEEKSPIEFNNEEIEGLKRLISNIISFVSNVRNKTEIHNKFFCLDCDAVLIEILGVSAILGNVNVTCHKCGSNHQITYKE